MKLLAETQSVVYDIDSVESGLADLLAVVSVAATKSQLGFLMSVSLKRKLGETLTRADLFEVYSNLI